MSAGRMFATLAVIAAGMLAAGLLISRAARTLHNDGLFNTGAPGLLQPGPAAAPTHQVRHGPTPRRVPGRALAPGASPRAPGTPPHGGTREAGPSAAWREALGWAARAPGS